MGQYLLQSVMALILGAIGGSLGTFVALRTRLDMMSRDISDEGVARKRLEARSDEKLNMLERRSILTLKITVDIARQLGVDKRQFDDALVNMLTNVGDGEKP